MSARKQKQVVVGYAAETEELESRACEKLAKKGADAIVGNLVGNGRAFGTDDNEALLVSRTSTKKLPLMAKDDLAHAILDYVS